MTPKERRDRLFKSGRPHIRPLEIYDGNKYHKDIGILWVAHKRKPFYSFDKDIPQGDFAKEIEKVSVNTELVIAEDVNKEFKGNGPVALIAIHGNGWKIEPHAEFFRWSSPKNVLRVSVAFFQMVRYRKIGACAVYTPEIYSGLFNKCCAYGVLHPVGKIINGDPRGDELVYSVRGKKNGRIST